MRVGRGSAISSNLECQNCQHIEKTGLHLLLPVEIVEKAKTAFTIVASNRLRYDSRPRFGTNHLDAKPIANPSSLSVVNLVSAGGNLGLHSHCIWEHGFELVRMSRYNDVEISLLQQCIH